MLPQGLKNRNQLGLTTGVGPGGSAVLHGCENTAIAVRTDAGEEMSNSAFGTGFVVNRQ